MQERDMSLLRAMTGLEYEIRYADEAQGFPPLYLLGLLGGWAC
jgi:hypothetical protein